MGSLDDNGLFSVFVVVVVVVSILLSAFAVRTVSELHSSKQSSKKQALTDGNKDDDDDDGNDNDDVNSNDGDTIFVGFRSAKSETSSFVVDDLLFLSRSMPSARYFALRCVALLCVALQCDVVRTIEYKVRVSRNVYL